MKMFIRNLVAIISLSALPFVVNASLIGDTVNGTLHYNGFTDNWFDVGSGGSGSTAVVGAGQEFSTSNSFAFPVRVDLGAESLKVTHAATSGPGSANGWDLWLEDLDWLPNPGYIVDIVGGSTAIPGLTLDFGDDYIHISADGFDHPGQDLVVEYRLIVSHVPVPAAAWLFLSGLGMLGFSVRRRRVTTV